MKTVRTLLLLLFVAGIAAAFGKAFIWGESVTKYGAYVPWGLWIGIYIALVGAAAGCVVWGAWLSPQNSNGKGTEIASALLSAAFCLAFGLAFVGIDLGKPLQGFRIFLHPAFASPLAWASWLYGLFFVCVAGYFLTAMKRPLLLLAVVGAIGFTVAEALFFGQMVSRPLWNSWLTTLLFLAAAASAGAALLLLVWQGTGLKVDSVVLAKLRKVLAATLIIYALVEGIDVMMALSGSPEKVLAVKRMIASYGFWLLYGVIGTLIPLLLLLRTERAQLAAVLSLVGAVGSKYAFVRYGFVPEPMPGLSKAFQDAALQTRYFPSMVEWVVAVGLLAGLVWLILWAVEKILMPKAAQ
jgi:molybdopterin-containing oxidoreductase family membrane subunit